MHIAKRFPPSLPVYRSAETAAAIWVMIVILLGVASFALFTLWDKVGG